MGKFFKYLSACVAMLVVLVILAIVLLMTVVNPNNYKSEISKIAQQQTGRNVTIAGNISWSFFPWLGFKVHDITMANAPGFNKTPFAHVGTADVSVMVTPLLSGKIEVGKIVLANAQINLIKNAQGQNNWADLLKHSQKNSNASKTTATKQVSTTTSDRKLQIAISNIDISNAKVSWQDQQTGQAVTISNLTINSKGFNLGQPFPVTVRLNVNSKKPDLHAELAFSSKVTLNPNNEIYTLKNLVLTNAIRDKKHPTGKFITNLRGNLKVNLKTNTVTFANIELTSGGMRITGNLSGTQIMQTPLLKGNFKVYTFNLKSFLNKAGIKLQTIDPQALSTVSASGNFQASPKFFKLTNLKAMVDNTNITGSLNFNDFTRNALDFNVSMDRINFDRYMPKQQAAKTGSKLPKPSLTKTTLGNPFAAFAKYNVAGNYAIKQFTYGKMQFSNLKGQLTINNGYIKIAPVNMNLYGGSSSANIVINAKAPVAHYQVNEKLANVQIGPLMKSIGKGDKVTGVANFNSQLSFSGNDSKAMISSLNGTINMHTKNGTIKGVDFAHQLARAFSLVQKSQTSERDTSSTKFSNFSADFNIRNGIASTDNLLLDSDALDVTAQGSSNIAKQSLNFRVLATALTPLKISSGNFKFQTQNVKVPFQILGTYNNPKIIPDIAALARVVLQGTLQEQIQQGVTKNLGKNAGEQIQKILDIFKQ